MSNFKKLESLLMIIFFVVYLILFLFQFEVTFLSVVFDLVISIVLIGSIIVSFQDDTIIIKHADLLDKFEVTKSNHIRSLTELQSLENNDNLLDISHPENFAILEEIKISRSQLFDQLKYYKETQEDIILVKKEKSKSNYLMRFTFLFLSFLAMSHFIRVLRNADYLETATPFLVYFMVMMTMIGLVAFIFYLFENKIIKNKIVAEIKFLLDTMNYQGENSDSFEILIDDRDDSLYLRKILPDWDLTLFYPNFSVIRVVIIFLFTMHLLTQISGIVYNINNWQFSDPGTLYMFVYYVIYLVLIMFSIYISLVYDKIDLSKTTRKYTVGLLFTTMMLSQILLLLFRDNITHKVYASLLTQIILYTETFYFLIIGFHFYFIGKYFDDLIRYIKLKRNIEEILLREYNSMLLNFNPKGQSNEFQLRDILNIFTKKNSLENVKNLPSVPDKKITLYAALIPVVITLLSMIYQLYQNRAILPNIF